MKRSRDGTARVQQQDRRQLLAQLQMLVAPPLFEKLCQQTTENLSKFLAALGDIRPV